MQAVCHAGVVLPVIGDIVGVGSSQDTINPTLLLDEFDDVAAVKLRLDLPGRCR